MTDKGKILAEIERLTKVTGYALSEYENGRRSAMYDIRKQLIEYINSLPAEQPSERLGDEIDHFRCSDEFALAKRAGEEVSVTAQHFAQWQKERMMKSAIDALVDEDTENVGKKILLFIGEQRDALNTQLSNYEYGETVKLVVIKEEK